MKTCKSFKPGDWVNIVKSFSELKMGELVRVEIEGRLVRYIVKEPYKGETAAFAADQLQHIQTWRCADSRTFTHLVRTNATVCYHGPDKKMASLYYENVVSMTNMHRWVMWFRWDSNKRLYVVHKERPVTEVPGSRFSTKKK